MSEKFPGIKKIKLVDGGHNERHNGTCLMEAVAWFMGQKHTQRPCGVNNRLVSHCQQVNDIIGDRARQRLRYLIPEIAALAPKIPAKLFRDYEKMVYSFELTEIQRVNALKRLVWRIQEHQLAEALIALSKEKPEDLIATEATCDPQAV